MSGAIAALAPTTTGESVAFWIIAVVATTCAIGVIVVRNAVHAAVLLAGVMLSLAVAYAVQGAPFLAMVQVIVYTGAIMMLFLFVLMLIGVDKSEAFVEVLRGQRVAVAVLALGVLGLLVLIIGRGVRGLTGTPLGDKAGSANVLGLAELIFTKYVVAFELTSALLITAALGAMVLAHRERLTPRVTQRELSQRRFAPGQHPTPLPAPGTFANHNAVDTPALLPDGSVAPGSVSPVLQGIAASRYPEISGHLVPDGTGETQ